MAGPVRRTGRARSKGSSCNKRLGECPRDYIRTRKAGGKPLRTGPRKRVVSRSLVPPASKTSGRGECRAGIHPQLRALARRKRGPGLIVTGSSPLAHTCRHGLIKMRKPAGAGDRDGCRWNYIGLFPNLSGEPVRRSDSGISLFGWCPSLRPGLREHRAASRSGCQDRPLLQRPPERSLVLTAASTAAC
jgi:hypothetical protein